MKIGKPKYVDQCCNKKHRSNHYQKQHRAEHLGDVKMSLWFSIRSMENLEAFHASRATSNINISSVVSTLICNVIFCLLEISGDPFVDLLCFFPWTLEANCQPNHPVFFVTIRMWCSLSGEKPSSVPFPELVRSVPIRGGDCFLKATFAGCQRLIVCSECLKESYKVFKQQISEMFLGLIAEDTGSNENIQVSVRHL